MVAITSFSQPPEPIRHKQPNTTVFVNDNNLGKGILYIAESCLTWCGDSGNGFSLEYPHIGLHAISRDLNNFPQECIFMMLNRDFDGETDNLSSDENSDENVTTQMRLVPDDRGMLDAMFHALNYCQTLHPDPEDSFSDEDNHEDADDYDSFTIDETESQMADLRIRNMDGTPHIVEGIFRDMVEDLEEDRVGGILEDKEEDSI